MHMYKSDEPNSKVLLVTLLTLRRFYFTHKLYLHLGELEMKGFTQIEGKSTQGSDK